MSGWYTFEYVKLGGNPVERPDLNLPPAKTIKAFTKPSHVQASMRYCFGLSGIRLTRSVTAAFARELEEEHGEAFRRMLGGFTRWSEGMLRSAFRDGLPPILKVIDDPSPEQLGLVYRFSLLEEIFRIYAHSTSQVHRLEVVDKEFYREMHRRLQQDSRFAELSMTMRVAAAVADGVDPESVRRKWAGRQNFGCLFWLFC